MFQRINVKTVKKLGVLIILILAASVSAQTKRNSLTDKLNEYFTASTNLKNFNGNVIVAKDDKVLLDKTYNIGSEVNGLKVNKDSKFIIASVSKVFIKYSILKLVELRKLQLTDTLDKFVSDFPNGDKITVEQLMYHRSGLPRELTDYEKLDDLLLDKIVESAKSEKLQFQPGTQTLYSNVGYFLLHYIIDKSSNRGYAAFIRNQILEPLKLKNTGEFNSAKSLKNFAYGFNNEDGKIVVASKKSINRFETGNYFSTVSDLYSFSRQLSAGAVLDKSLAEKMFGQDGILVQAGGRPGYRAYFYKNLKNGVTFIFVANYTDIPIQELTADIVNILDEKPYEVPRKINRTAVKLPPEILKRYVGKFALEADDTQTFTVELSDGKLFISDKGGAKSEVYSDSETTFFDSPTSKDGYIFTLNPQTNKYDLTIISTGLKLNTKRL